jgi:hypothetical protein
LRDLFGKHAQMLHERAKRIEISHV